MKIHLTPELEKLVEAEVASGQYASASEVIREALRLLVEERRWREEVRCKISDGVAEAKAGKLVHGEPAFERLRARIDSHSRGE